MYLEVIWHQDYNRFTNEPDPCGNIVTAMVVPDLRNVADKAWMDQRKIDIANNINII